MLELNTQYFEYNNYNITVEFKNNSQKEEVIKFLDNTIRAPIRDSLNAYTTRPIISTKIGKFTNYLAKDKITIELYTNLNLFPVNNKIIGENILCLENGRIKFEEKLFKKYAGIIKPLDIKFKPIKYDIKFIIILYEEYLWRKAGNNSKDFKLKPIENQGYLYLYKKNKKIYSAVEEDGFLEFNDGNWSREEFDKIFPELIEYI